MTGASDHDAPAPTGARPAAGGSLPLLLALVAGITVFRLAALAFNRTDFFVDESQYWSWGLEPAFGYYSKPPLLAWMLAATRSVCGDGEVCLRAPVSLIHAGTALVLFALGRRLYGDRAGFWAAIGFLTLPGISYSAGVVSTDVPLLFLWAVALHAFVRLLEAPSLGVALVLGAAFGLGLNAKYAMAYFLPLAAIFFLMSPPSRALLRRPHLWIALGLGAGLILPNLAWNAAHKFATFRHTADNANWRGGLFHPANAAEFFISQAGAVGPILFGALLIATVAAARRWAATSTADRLTIAFSVPLILAITLQGLLSRALANWAAPAYVAAMLLVAGALVRWGRTGWLRASLGLHLAAMLGLAVANAEAGRFTLPNGVDPFARTLGKRATGTLVRDLMAEAAAAGRPFGTVLAGERDLAATLLYYAPELAPRLRAWRWGGTPRDHYELTRPFTRDDREPVLHLTRGVLAAEIKDAFTTVEDLGERAVPVGETGRRLYHAYRLSGHREP
jgi:4-amino-4-deoxy-L-arabinose transferase-like glycosyltransferase